MKIGRQLRYCYIRIRRLNGDPHVLALGFAFGVFSAMMPIIPFIPFHTILALTLALFLGGSKITAIIGTWVSNPLDWYFQYKYSYKLGALILGISEKNGLFPSAIESMGQAEGPGGIFLEIMSTGSSVITALFLGGFIMGVILSIPSYFLFLRFFRSLRAWREKRRAHEH